MRSNIAAWGLGAWLGGCAGGEAAPVLLAEGLPAGLLSVRAPTADDVWVVGASSDPEDGAGPWLLHHDGATWTRRDTSSWPGAELWWIHVTAETITAVGDQGLILEGSRDGALTAVRGPSADTTFFGVWGADADDVWAVGSEEADAGPRAVIWRRTGGAWAEMDVTTEADRLFKVHGSAVDDVWIVGSRGTTLYWDGTALVPESTPSDTAPLLTVDVGSEAIVAVGGTGNGLILERDGGSWVDVSPDFQPGYNGVCSGAGQTWAVGQRGARAQRVGGSWVPDEERDVASLILDDWHGCDVDPDGGLWFVGGRIASRPLRDGAVGYQGPGNPPSVDVP